MKIKLEEIIEAMDKLYDLNLEKQWYQYRDEAYEKIARQWCERHKIAIIE